MRKSLAILLAVEHWPCLQFAQFVIHTDQRSVVRLEDQRLATPWQHEAMAKLLGLHDCLVYNKGVDNRAVEPCRACRSLFGRTVAISTCVPAWQEEISSGYLHDPETQKILARLKEPFAVCSPYTFANGLLRLQGRLWFVANPTVQRKILHALHNGAIGSHPGGQVTYVRTLKMFVWHRLKQDVLRDVAACTTCKQTKTERVWYPGLLQPLQILDGAWQVVSLDFIEGLLRSSCFDCIMVISTNFANCSWLLSSTVTRSS